jgi:hypothetical protein
MQASLRTCLMMATNLKLDFDNNLHHLNLLIASLLRSYTKIGTKDQN